MWTVRAFLVINMLWGLLLAYRIPPFGGTDEAYHWLRAEEISYGELFARRLGPNNWGGEADTRSLQFIAYFGTRYAQNQPIDRHAAHALARQLQTVENTIGIVSFPSTASFPPLAYLPGALGIALPAPLVATSLRSYTADGSPALYPTSCCAGRASRCYLSGVWQPSRRSVCRAR
jgi:hypothetical protein